MKETYDKNVTPYSFYEGQRCYLFDPVAKPNECFKLRRKWRGEFIIHKLSSHNAFLYNPKTNNYIEKSVHINRIKPCYQRDDIPADDEDIEDIPLVEVTYPLTFPKTVTFPNNHPKNMEQDMLVPNTHADLEIDNPPTPLNIDTDRADQADPTASPTILAPPMITEQQQEQQPEPELPFWNTLKIVRQSTGKGKLQYLIRWEDPTAPDSWSDAADVNDEVKRVFYLTHTKTGNYIH